MFVVHYKFHNTIVQNIHPIQDRIRTAPNKQLLVYNLNYRLEKEFCWTEVSFMITCCIVEIFGCNSPIKSNTPSVSALFICCRVEIPLKVVIACLVVSSGCIIPAISDSSAWFNNRHLKCSRWSDILAPNNKIKCAA